MKYFVLFITVAIAFAGLNSCSKNDPIPSPVNSSVEDTLLVRHTWYLKYETINTVVNKTPCVLSEQLTFKKDSTGNHYYSILCDTTQQSTVTFNWDIEGNYDANGAYPAGYTLYYHDVSGKPDSTVVMDVMQLTKDSLLIKGSINGGQAYIGLFTAQQ